MKEANLLSVRKARESPESKVLAVDMGKQEVIKVDQNKCRHPRCPVVSAGEVSGAQPRITMLQWSILLTNSSATSSSSSMEQDHAPLLSPEKKISYLKGSSLMREKRYILDLCGEKQILSQWLQSIWCWAPVTKREPLNGKDHHSNNSLPSLTNFRRQLSWVSLVWLP